MRKILTLVLLTLLAGCMTYNAQASQDSVIDQDYEVLGWVRVNYDDSILESSNPRELLMEKAKGMYPSTDAVIDVVFYSRWFMIPVILAPVPQGFYAEGKAVKYK